MADQLNVLFIGDIVGRLGRAITKSHLPDLKMEHSIDLTIANGENSASGYGMTEKVYKELVEMGIDAVTMGNHTYDKKDYEKFLKDMPNIARPANYPPQAVGRDHVLLEVNGLKIAVINLLGRVFMQCVDDPFRAAKALVEKLKGETNIIIVDIHAEATSEKMAMGYFLDGSVSAVLGTHTHVMTADERILTNGTAYISDIGMTGAYDSVIGMEKEQILSRFTTGMPIKFEPTTTGTGLLNAVVIRIDVKSGKAKEIKRIQKIIYEQRA
jgi:metallophosphoesterase (TIGR00282 family)